MRYCILLFCLLSIDSILIGQELSYRQDLPKHDSLSQDIALQFDKLSKPFSPAPHSQTQIPAYFIPSYARANPSGYSYLCRLELKIEDELPLGIWIRADEKAAPGGSLYLRMKLLRF